MKLRKPCEHGKYDDHHYSPTNDRYYVTCPGGVFLPDDTLENAAQALCEWDVDAGLSWRGQNEGHKEYYRRGVQAVLDALSVREADLEGDLHGRD